LAHAIQTPARLDYAMFINTGGQHVHQQPDDPHRAGPPADPVA